MSELPRTLFKARLPGIARPLSAPEGARMTKYLNLLVKWQKTQRLIGSAEPAWIIENVFLDGLCFLEALSPEARLVADLGSGAGIPGIPIAIVRPDLELVLIESRQRRVSFLSTVVRELELRSVTVLGRRAEAVAEESPLRFDAVVMRCAAKVEAILDVAVRLVRPGGSVIVGAGPSLEVGEHGEEVVVRTPTGTLRTFHRYRKPGPDSH